ncbi:MAG: thiolase family protein [Ferrovibrio sp.]|uniref:thiolase family protein n=1 Tax=Ferrovibrio sp. TaxID=1917215 RepID=UPI003918A547
MSPVPHALTIDFDDIWLAGGARTPFADYMGPLADVSPIDLGIKAAREALKKTEISGEEIDTVVAGSMAQASYDAYMLPRHIGLYAGVPVGVPAHLVQRVCGTGIEAIIQAASQIRLGQAETGLVVGAESMSRNPVASYTHRNGFRMGQVEFKDFLWEALIDPAPGIMMGDTAENLAREYQITREEVDVYAAESFDRALKAREDGFFTDEIVPVASEEFALKGYNPRGVRLGRKTPHVTEDTHVRPSPVEALAKIRPAFGGVQTGGNSSGVVDGAAAAVVASGAYLRRKGKVPLARIIAGASVGVPPEIMGIGPVPAIRAVCAKAGIDVSQVDRFEINEAFGAQVMACMRALEIPRDRLNVNGGAIAIGHPLAATGVRLAVTVARELRRSGLRYGVASACIGGGQGIALLVENPEAAASTV